MMPIRHVELELHDASVIQKGQLTARARSRRGRVREVAAYKRDVGAHICATS
jgi:hypothetical protein